MIAAFGTSMLNSGGLPCIELCDKIWKTVIQLRGKQSRPPRGALGRKITVSSKNAEQINSAWFIEI